MPARRRSFEVDEKKIKAFLAILCGFADPSGGVPAPSLIARKISLLSQAGKHLRKRLKSADFGTCPHPQITRFCSNSL